MPSHKLEIEITIKEEGSYSSREDAKASISIGGPVDFIKTLIGTETFLTKLGDAISGVVEKARTRDAGSV